MDTKLKELAKEVNAKLIGFDANTRKEFIETLIAMTPEHQHKVFVNKVFPASPEKLAVFNRMFSDFSELAVMDDTDEETESKMLMHGFEITNFHVSPVNVTLDLNVHDKDGDFILELSVSFSKLSTPAGPSFNVEIEYPDLGTVSMIPTSKKFSLVEHVFNQDGCLGLLKMFCSDQFSQELVK